MLSKKLSGQVAIVSGGSRGIGQGIGLALAALGADIAFCHYRDDRLFARSAKQPTDSNHKGSDCT